MKLVSSLRLVFTSFLIISFVAGLGLHSGLSYLKEITYGASERTIAKNIRSLTEEAALYRDAQGINETLSAIYNKGYFFRVSLPDNFTVIFPKDLFSPIWETKADYVIQSETASKELLTIEVWNTNDNSPVIWKLLMWGIPSILVIFLLVSYFVLRQLNGDVKTVEEYLETGEKDILEKVKFKFFQHLVSLLVKSESVKKQLFDAERESQRRKEISRFAEMVCHDIRSPLEALRFLTSSKNLDIVERKELLISVVKRIESIIESLNSRQKMKKEVFDLVPYIKNLVIEKNIEFNDLAVKIDVKGVDVKSPIYLEGDVYVLMRGLSNIINNSIEAAIPSKQLEIVISVSLKGQFAQISISDNGKGIPAEIVTKLGRRGFSYNKQSGTGLGLYDIKTKIESSGGSFRIDSIEGVGTLVSINYPLIESVTSENEIEQTLNLERKPLCDNKSI